jgi:acyl carrier protein
MGSDPDPQLTDDAAAKLSAALSEVFDYRDELRLRQPLQEIDGWDSMSAVNFTLELESVFDVDLSGIILSGEQTLLDVIALLAEKGAALTA